MASDNPNTVKAKRYFERNPWARHVLWARERCTNPKAKAWPSHGAKGIRCFLTMAEAKTLWHEGRAAEMKKPSLDRRESDKHYCLHNCRFIEFKLNSALPHNAELRAKDQGDPSWLAEDPDFVPF
jgi:hypothetical protein